MYKVFVGGLATIGKFIPMKAIFFMQKAIALKAPVLIECMIPEDDKVFPMVPAGAPISEVFDGDDLKRQS